MKKLILVPNIISISRIFLAIVFCQVILMKTSWAPLLSLIIYLICSISDFLDGYIARKWNCTSSLGSWLDRIADKVLLIISCFCFYAHHLLFALVAFLLITREIIVVSLLIANEIQSKKYMAVTVLSKYKTALFFILGIICCTQLVFPLVPLKGIIIIIQMITVLLSLYTGIKYINHWLKS